MIRLCELMEKDVISLDSGQCLGRVGDVEIEVREQKVCTIVIFDRLRFFGLFGREDDLLIRWEDIELIGEDTILVKKTCGCKPPPRRKKRFF